MPSKLPEKMVVALEVLGFGRGGLIKRSIAAKLFGGYQPARGAFATLQSAGAGGYGVKVLHQMGMGMAGNKGKHVKQKK